MAFDIVGEIRKKSREEWIQLLRDKWLDLRILTQENGELALIAGIIFGIFFVIAFKFFVAVAVILILIAFVILKIAQPAGSSVLQSSTAISNSADPTVNPTVSANGSPKDS